MCDTYLLSYYKELVTEILQDPDETKHFSLNINFVELSGNDPNLGNNFLRDPKKSLEEWNSALKKIQTNLILQSEANYVFKNHAHCRIYSLPLYPELHRTKFPQNEDTGKFLQVSGTVVRMTAIKMLEYQRQYICTKCKYKMSVNADYDLKNIIVPPKKCGNPVDCKGTNITSLGELQAEFCKDYQEIKMQETVSKLDVRSMPSSMWVTLEDDLVDSCKPGDSITVCGLIRRRQNQFSLGRKMEIELVIEANHVQVNNNNTSALSITPELKDMFQGFWMTYSDRPLVARDIILKSICPQLFGLYMVKLAMAVVLAGGSNLHNNSTTGVRVRSEPHLLLVGDPGTGKSQLLRFASKIIPRSVLTTGVGTTAAGLTVAAVMENGEWQLEGGALVMSDGGICCIDEFNTMKEHDRTSIHEAMEQQTISVAKAGIVCKLSTRSSILAATNPKGNLDPSQPLNINVALASPLLSRFDLILLLKDKLDQEWDSHLVDYIFSSFDNCNSSKLAESINWTVETLQAYFALIKKIHPILTDDSTKILSGYYQAQRRKNYRNKSRTTVRLLDSLVRLSQGHARLMYHEEVEVVDAVVAVILVETAMDIESSVFNLNFNLRNDFPRDPTTNYRELVKIVLKRLDLGDLLKKELERMDLKKSDRPGPPKQKTESRPGPSKAENMSPKKETEPESRPSPSKSENMLPKKKTEPECRPGPSIQENLSPKTTKAKSKFFQFQNSSHEENTSKMINKKQNADKEIGIDSHEKENEPESNRPSAKRTKSKTNTKSKKIKLQNDDVAALKSIPSINDIFRIDEDEQGINNEELETNTNKKIEVERIPAICTKGDVPEDQEAVLSQRTRTKNWFSKFRLIPKDNEVTTTSIQPESTTASIQPQLSQENHKENDSLGDISFSNVHSSTQVEGQKEPQPKKFIFKKVTNLKAPSIFETQEDVDDLDLDI